MKTNFKNTTLSKNKRGFTLLEAVMAMAIFSIGILAVGSMQLWNTKNNTSGNFTTQATMLARQKIEELKVVSDIDDLASGNDTIGIFRRRWVPSDITGTLSRITVTVEWTRQGKDHSVEIESITRGN
ncbi:MAG: prepilin-type N-terminal cleavage/methylation domain-containing protein [Desulfobacterales bacterium]|jgi:prepilin-type N-terminal cleavage/methylation domain-containing protein